MEGGSGSGLESPSQLLTWEPGPLQQGFFKDPLPPLSPLGRCVCVWGEGARSEIEQDPSALGPGPVYQARSGHLCS